MTKATILMAAAGAILLAGAPAGAGIPVKEKMTCPIGGKEFEFTTTASYTVFGTRADGKPYGSWKFPLALPECPDNGLVLYKDYTPEEVAKLEPLVASEAYQSLRLEDTPYYRAYWLMKAMDLPPESHLWALVQAGWEADGKPLLRARYLSELAEESAKVAADPKNLNWIGMEGRAVNALRELGRFDEALARLDKIPLDGLKTAAGATDDDAKSKRGWLDYFETQRKLIARADASPEPFEMMPRREALARCEKGDELDTHQTAWCETARADEDAKKAALRAKELETIGKERAR